MYRPPDNSNRVKIIRSKFENAEGGGLGEAKTDRVALGRQLSDPAKRNIKRTPAFRFDRNAADKAFQRGAALSRSHYFDNKVKLCNSSSSSAAKNDCDNNRNVINNNDKSDRADSNGNSATNVPEIAKPKPLLIKSKSSHDFVYIRSKFDKKINDNQRQNDTNSTTQPEQVVDLSQLYTEPIPKAQRNKNDHVYSNVDPIYSATTIKISDQEQDQRGLTDTLKTALKRPLPAGPAPKKPPRTFEHISPVKQLHKNESFLHVQQQQQQKDPCEKSKSARSSPLATTKDVRYMLNKLELALRTNKIKSKGSPRPEISTTSGEDSDDSLLFRSKSKRDFPALPEPPDDDDSSPPSCPSAFTFNCLSSAGSKYERIKEPNSSFFVSCEEEPVYAEPFHDPDDGPHNTEISSGNGGVKEAVNKNIRNSLYYMSTSLLCDDDNETMGQTLTKQDFLSARKEPKTANNHHQMYASENSSLSSFTSDMESAASTPVEESKSLTSAHKIKRLIDAFETKQPAAATYPRSGAGLMREDELPKNRVDNLKMSLQSTLDRCFSNDLTIKDSNSDSEEKERKTSVDKIISKFQTYVKTMPKYRKPKLNRDDRLFYCCLIVGWDSEKPQIKFKFPRNVEVPHKIEDLCYPEAASGPLDKSNNAQCYSLVITNDKGERTFGYCRRVIPEGSTNCLPLAYCILSKHRAPRFYKKILTELESRHGIPDKLRDELINEFYRNKFPRPGESIRINVTAEDANIRSGIGDDSQRRNGSLDMTSFVHVTKAGEYGTLNKVKKKQNDGKTELVLTLHHDLRYEDADLKPLHKLPPHILLKVFASLLLERKVILISCVISKLSSCVDALQSILYPFSWPHTFIPILPQCLWDVVESPTPVICGILSVAVVNQYRIEHGIVVDLDVGNILSDEGDEDSILSSSMKKAWEQGISLANTVPPEDYVHSVYLSDAYIKVFIVSLKNYKNYIVDGSFQSKTFIRNGKTKGVRRFLKWFTETSLFASFIDTVINDPDSFTLFDQKMEMYGSDDSNLILSKLLEWKK